MIYTEKEIKAWFKAMKERYPNSLMYEHLESVEYMMFYDTFSSKDHLKTFKKMLDKN